VAHVIRKFRCWAGSGLCGTWAWGVVCLSALAPVTVLPAPGLGSFLAAVSALRTLELRSQRKRVLPYPPGPMQGSLETFFWMVWFLNPSQSKSQGGGRSGWAASQHCSRPTKGSPVGLRAGVEKQAGQDRQDVPMGQGELEARQEWNRSTNLLQAAEASKAFRLRTD
jgi:hypothetical protein